MNVSYTFNLTPPHGPDENHFYLYTSYLRNRLYIFIFENLIAGEHPLTRATQSPHRRTRRYSPRHYPNMGFRIKGDERILGSSDFVERVSKKADEGLP